jgi:hypothetical protein
MNILKNINVRIAAVDGGTYYHHATLHDPALRPYFERLIYAPELSIAALDDIDILYVSARQDPELMVAAAPRIRQFLNAGKTVVALGESQSERWLPGVQWYPREVNFWWWLTPGADSGLRNAQSAHTLWQHIRLPDATWHQHGFFIPPQGCHSVIDHVDGGSIFYEDTITTPGRMVLTTLDPCYHHGSYFMPATTRFLQGFLPWLCSTPITRPPLMEAGF